MRAAFLCGAIFCLLVPGLSSQFELKSEASLDRTAFFVGEPIRYQVKVRHDPQIEFITDRLDKATLELAPFKIQDLTVEKSQTSGVNLLTITLRLVTYEIAQKKWEIPSFNLYYISRKSPASSASSPVQLFSIPAVPVAFRSSLPDDSNRIRTEILFRDFTGAFWAVLSVGVVGLLMAGGLGANLAYQRFRRAEPEREERSVIERKTQEAMSRLLANDAGEDVETTLEFYRQMTVILRDYSAKVSEKAGASLTALEINETLSNAGESPERVRLITELVALGDKVRYAEHGVELGTNRRAAVREELTNLFRN